MPRRRSSAPCSCSTSRSARRVGPGELDIPAVRGARRQPASISSIGRATLGRVWDVEFDADRRGAAPADAGLTRVDHISQSMHVRGDADLAAVLHLAARSREDAAPGRARSRRPGAKPGRRAERRRACASSSTPRRASARCRRASSPSCSAPACSTSRSRPTTSSRPSRGCATNGVELLPIPENYYDDLEARTDLAAGARSTRLRRKQHPLRPRRRRRVLPGLHADLRQRLLLRDRRAAGLSGYGAANAPIRLAAQTRLAPHPAMPRA